MEYLLKFITKVKKSSLTYYIHIIIMKIWKHEQIFSNLRDVRIIAIFKK